MSNLFTIHEKYDCEWMILKEVNIILVSLIIILSQCPGWIYPGEFHDENLACKNTPWWKTFQPIGYILHNLTQPGGNVK